MRLQLCGEVCGNDVAELYRCFGITVCCPKDIRTAIENCPEDEELVLEVNSGGGSVYAGFEMYSLLRARKGRTVAEIQSIAASAMSVIVAACESVRMSPVAEIMIHRAYAVADGTSQNMRQAAQMLDTIDESILVAYLEKTGGKSDREKLARMMRRETFLTAQEAIECGLADELLEAAVSGSEPDGGQSLLDLIPGLAVARATQAGTDKPDFLQLIHARQIPPVEDLIRLKADREEEPPMPLFPTADAAKAASADFLSAVSQGTDIQNHTEGEETNIMADEKSAGTPTAQANIATPEQLAEAFPELVSQIRASAAEAAATAERERIAKIDKAALPGFEELIANAKADPNKTAGDVALEIIEAQKASGKAYIASRDADVSGSKVNDVSATVAPDAGQEPVDEVGLSAKEAVELWRKGGVS